MLKQTYLLRENCVILDGWGAPFQVTFWKHVLSGPAEILSQDSWVALLRPPVAPRSPLHGCCVITLCWARLAVQGPLGSSYASSNSSTYTHGSQKRLPRLLYNVFGYN